MGAPKKKPAVPGARVLGLEAGGDHLAVALLAVPDAPAGGPPVLLDEVVTQRGHRHADHLLVLVDAILARHDVTRADLALVGVGRGPGSFTGIRVGLATALGLAAALPVTAWPVCSLAALACHVPRGLALPMLDARRGEVYAGLFRMAGGAPEVLVAPAATTVPAMLAAAAEAAPGEAPLVFGSGALAYGVASDVAPGVHVGAARHVAWLAARAWLAAGKDPAAAPPLDAAYLRRSEAEIAADARDAAAPA